ncbi:2Fe-2S iron-sulfur cluster-binding protein [Paraburkholderia heleia]|uniref:2Fe-2S iron-sulfur cluster-binding protein n=1 Tax=Paraburkholderia heleia TaxID=634127 RepID=UPI0038BAA47A
MTEFIFNDKTVRFREGETIAAALGRAGCRDFGQAANGQSARYFCGIGQCQGCLVSICGRAPVEACITPAQANTVLTPAFEAAAEKA